MGGVHRVGQGSSRGPFYRSEISRYPGLQGRVPRCSKPMSPTEASQEQAEALCAVGFTTSLLEFQGGCHGQCPFALLFLLQSRVEEECVVLRGHHPFRVQRGALVLPQAVSLCTPGSVTQLSMVFPAPKISYGEHPSQLWVEKRA